MPATHRATLVNSAPDSKSPPLPVPYFNYSLHALQTEDTSYWDRRAFLHAWWSLYEGDERWIPPHYNRLRQALDPRRNEHIVRLTASLIHVDALHRTGVRRSRTDQQELPLVSVLERPLAAAVLAVDRRRRGKTAHLAIPHFSADREAFDVLYYHLVERLSERDYHRVVAPVGISPHLGSGLQVDGWDDWPPSHAPSNPPYVPELVERRWRPLQVGRLYRHIVPPDPPAVLGSPAAIRPFDPARLSSDLLPLLVAATDNPGAGFPPPDTEEATLLLRLLGPASLSAYLAEIDGLPAGFVLLGPDTSPRLRATQGGRPLWGRALLGFEDQFSPHSRVTGGRIYYGAVLPDFRGRGIGRQLWQRSLGEAARRGWETLAIGPVWLPGAGVSPAAAFLGRQGAAPRQTYRLYEWSF